MIGSSKMPSGTTRMRTSSPSKRNSRGRRTAWLRPLRKSLASFGIGRSWEIVYIHDIYQCKFLAAYGDTSRARGKGTARGRRSRADDFPALTGRAIFCRAYGAEREAGSP